MQVLFDTICFDLLSNFENTKQIVSDTDHNRRLEIIAGKTYTQESIVSEIFNQIYESNWGSISFDDNVTLYSRLKTSLQLTFNRKFLRVINKISYQLTQENTQDKMFLYYTILTH